MVVAVIIRYDAAAGQAHHPSNVLLTRTASVVRIVFLLTKEYSVSQYRASMSSPDRTMPGVRTLMEDIPGCDDSSNESRSKCSPGIRKFVGFENGISGDQQSVAGSTALAWGVSVSNVGVNYGNITVNIDCANN